MSPIITFVLNTLTLKLKVHLLETALKASLTKSPALFPGSRYLLTNYSLFIHTLVFKNPQIVNIFQSLKNFKLPPPPPALILFIKNIYFTNHSKVLKKLLNQELQTN